MSTNLQHGELVSMGLHTQHPFYKAWANMKGRCDIPSSTLYEWYGGRGIDYCEEWRDFRVFYKDMWGAWSQGLTLDRIDNNLGYSKENCRWATRTQQNRNSGRNVLDFNTAERIRDIYTVLPSPCKLSAIAKWLNVSYRNVYNVAIAGQWK